MKELKIGCGKPTGSRLGETERDEKTMEKSASEKEGVMTTATVGAKAPDFEAPAYQGGNFGQVSLSDYVGKWVVLCFYPGDFTFV